MTEGYKRLNTYHSRADEISEIGQERGSVTIKTK